MTSQQRSASQHPISTTMCLPFLPNNITHQPNQHNTTQHTLAASSAWWLSMRRGLGTTTSGSRRRSASKMLPAPAWLMTSAAARRWSASEGAYSKYSTASPLCSRAVRRLGGSSLRGV
jgi:hypothetical protein